MGRSRGGSKRRGGEGNGWEGFGGYMAAKVQKLQGQFKTDEDEHIVKKSDIFQGIAIHVNGYTTPTWSVLRDLMKSHGGVYQHYYARSLVTHVIATNLAGSKAANLSAEVKVCTPNWITDSISEGRLLPYEDYRLYNSKTKKQHTLNVTRLSRSNTYSSRSSETSRSSIDAAGSMHSEDATGVSDIAEDSRFHEEKEESTEKQADIRGGDSDDDSNSNGQWNKSNMDLFDDIDDWEEKSSSEEEVDDNEITDVSILKNRVSVNTVEKTKRSTETHENSYDDRLSAETAQSYMDNELSKELSSSEVELFDEQFDQRQSKDVCSTVESVHHKSRDVSCDSLEDCSEFSEPSTSNNDQSSKVGQSNKLKRSNNHLEQSSSKTGSVQTFQNKTSEARESNNDVTQNKSFQSTSTPITKAANFRSPGKAGDSNFIGEFYQNSRLHYLSTWGAEFRAYVNELQSKGSDFPGRKKLLENGLSTKTLKTNQKAQRVIMHIDMDSFFVAVGLRNRPELKGKPVAVTHSRGKGAKEQDGANLQDEFERWRKKRAERSRFNKSKHQNLDVEQNPDLLKMFPDEDEEAESDINNSKTVALTTPQATFHSMAEIASCSYEAREAGVKNGMFMGQAKKLCPDLITIPYDFEGYRQVSQKLYDIIASYTHDIEAVSCDEMMVDLTELLESTGVSPLDFATILRDEIRVATGCNASAGIGPNILIARLATRLAKPNGQHWVKSEEVLGFIRDRSISELPGVGRAMSRKLESMGVSDCGDLQKISLQVLQKEFGPKTGQALYKSCRGQDDRPIKVERERKSVSAEINYGIRFTKESEATKFLEDLAQEVHNRMSKIKVKAKAFTLKLKVRSPDAPKETAKFLGHGVCDNVAKSVTLPIATDSPEVIAREVIVMLKNLKVKVEDLRGIGIQGSKLESATFGQRPTQAPGMQSILNFATKIPQNDKNSEGTSKSTSKAANDTSKSLNASSTSTQVRTSATRLDFSSPERKVAVEDVEHSNDSMDSINEVRVQNEVTGSKNQVKGHQCDLSVPLEEDELIVNTDRMDSSLPPLPHLPDLSTSFSSQQGFLSTAVTPVREVKRQDDEFFFSPSQIDPQVLGELPEDIRKQVLNDMKAQKSKKKRTKEPVEPPCVKPLPKAPPRGIIRHNSQEAGCSHWSEKNVRIQSPEKIPGSDDEDDIQMNVRRTFVRENNNPIVPLPAFSQIDPTFLDALPAELRNEIQNAYASEQKAKDDTPPQLPMMLPGEKEKQKNSPATSPYKTFENLMAAGRSPMKVNVGKSPKKSPGKVTGSRGRGSRGRGSRGQGSRGRGSRGRAKASLMEAFSPKKTGNDAPVGRSPEKEKTVIPEEPVWTHQPPDLCGATELPEVKSLLTQWINSSNEPDNEDSDQVIQYLNQLIQDKYLDVCHLVLKFLLRFISRKNMPTWKHCLDNIVAKTQNIVIAFHGAPLKL